VKLIGLVAAFNLGLLLNTAPLCMADQNSASTANTPVILETDNVDLNDPNLTDSAPTAPSMAATDTVEPEDAELELPALEYEKCDCTNKKYTDAITGRHLSFSFTALLDCNCTPLSIIKTPLLLINELISASQLPKECYHASMLLREKRVARRGFRMCTPIDSEIKSNFSQNDSFSTPECKEVTGKTTTTVRAPCLNEDYVRMTKETFEATMLCFDIQPRDIYPVINHESRFLLNSVSPTGASCYGQLTSGLIADLNKTDEISKLTFKDKCPNVASQFRKVNVISTEIKVKRADGSEATVTRTKLDGVQASCDITENPVSCMIYTALAHKKNLERIHKSSNDSPVYVVNNGSKQMLFSKHESAEKVGAVKPSPIFSDTKDVEELVVIWSYNGGGGVNVLYNSFLRDLRNELINAPSTSALRQEFAKNNGLKTETFYKLFSAYIRSNYKWVANLNGAKKQARRNEVANYVRKIRNELEIVENRIGLTGHACSNRDSFLNNAGAQ
jgi:hypothetical protein